MPHGMTQREWRALSCEARDEIERKAERKRRDDAVLFDSNMRSGPMPSDELTWLRGRVLELENRIAALEER